MPFPVSPDDGVPEHQSGPHRQAPPPRNGQFPSGARPPAGPFSSSRPQADPFARSGADHQAPGPSGPPDQDEASDGNTGKTGRPRDRLWSAVAFLIAAVVIGAVAFYFFGPKDQEDTAVQWAVDSCAAPSASASEGTATSYQPMLCDDPAATVTLLDIQDAVSISQVHCPTGTDVVFQKGGEAGGDTRAVCARNLSDDHPGDPGMGGGQLLTGDCVDEGGSEIACATDGARKVTGLIIGTNECPDGTADTIELGFDAERSYQTVCLGKA